MESKYKKIIFTFFFCFLYAHPILKTGDIILRKESNILSNLFSQIDPCGYSHSGIIIIKNKKPYVCNIEYEKKGENLKIVPLKSFLSLASSYVILEPLFKINQKKLKKIINTLKKQKIEFDTQISLTNNKYYCTELVDYIYYKLLGRHIYAYLYKFNNKKIITVRSLLKSRYFKLSK